ncbi:unnamed protein product [Closterium sp. NIES-64]|nr:unnamed protein product [Closterium sp. NIES-64]
MRDGTQLQHPSPQNPSTYVRGGFVRSGSTRIVHFPASPAQSPILPRAHTVPQRTMVSKGDLSSAGASGSRQLQIPATGSQGNFLRDPAPDLTQCISHAELPGGSHFNCGNVAGRGAGNGASGAGIGANGAVSGAGGIGSGACSAGGNGANSAVNGASGAVNGASGAVNGASGAVNGASVAGNGASGAGNGASDAENGAGGIGSGDCGAGSGNGSGATGAGSRNGSGVGGGTNGAGSGASGDGSGASGTGSGAGGVESGAKVAGSGSMSGGGNGAGIGGGSNTSGARIGVQGGANGAESGARGHSGSGGADWSPVQRADPHRASGTEGSRGPNTLAEERAEEKRRKRQLSNCASSRRARQRQHDRLAELELDTAKLKLDNASAQRRLSEANEQIRLFQARNERSEQEVRRLRLELKKLKPSDWNVDGDGNLEEGEACMPSEQGAARCQGVGNGGASSDPMPYKTIEECRSPGSTPTSLPRSVSIKPKLTPGNPASASTVVKNGHISAALMLGLQLYTIYPHGSTISPSILPFVLPLPLAFYLMSFPLPLLTHPLPPYPPRSNPLTLATRGTSHLSSAGARGDGRVGPADIHHLSLRSSSLPSLPLFLPVVTPPPLPLSYQSHISAALMRGGMDVSGPQLYITYPSRLPPYFRPSSARPLFRTPFPPPPSSYQGHISAALVLGGMDGSCPQL